MQQNCPSDLAAARERIQQVMAFMQAGQLTQAELLCRDVLRACPREAGVHHLIGLLNHQLGNNQLAVGFIQQAISLNPTDPEYHNNLGVVLLTLGQFEQAIAACSRALALRDNYPEACNNLGNALAASGRFNDALNAYDLALQQRPGYVEALNNRGNALRHLGKLDRAIADYERAIQLQPNYTEAHSNLGVALQSIGRVERAVASYRKAIALQPANYQSWDNLGAALFDIGKFDEALQCYRQCASLRPSAGEPFNNIGLVQQKIGLIQDAIASHRRALELRPDFPEAITALGTARRQNAQLDEAIACYERALSLRPQNPDALTFLGAALQEKGLLIPAMALHRQAIAIRPDHPEAHLNLALMLLAQGDFQEGWKEYEWRRRGKISPADRRFAQPQWRGEELCGQRILIHAEQGFGDALQFVRYVPWVARRGGKVLLECYPELHRLFANLPGVEQLLSPCGSPPQFDLHCPLLSLPLAFATTLDSIPSDSPYLRADPILTERWAARIRSDGGELNVGLAWAGSPTHLNDRNRSISPSLFNRLAAIPGVRYFSLQKRDPTNPAPFAVPDLAMTDWTSELNDFADTAAFVANLDLVITIDTAIAHLAGSIAKPAWVLLPDPADFRWLLDRDDSPWYPTLRSFRQPRPHDWDEPLTRIAQDLPRLVASRPPKII